MEALGTARTTEFRGTEAIAGVKSGTSTPSRKTNPRMEPEVSETFSAQKREVERSARDKIGRVAQAMDEYVKSHARDLKIEVTQGTGDIMVRVIATEDGRTIREIPPKELVNMAAKMEEMIGILFNEKV